MKEARQKINRLVQSKASSGYEPGSMVLFCNNRSAGFVSCDLIFTDGDGDQWCGHASATLRGGHITSRYKIEHGRVRVVLAHHHAWNVIAGATSVVDQIVATYAEGLIFAQHQHGIGARRSACPRTRTPALRPIPTPIRRRWRYSR